jgi:cell wall-associated NlpC family hydrolase
MTAALQYDDLIGKPFRYGARGPQEYDCWGLVRECYRRAHGVLLPDFASPEDLAVQHAVIATQRVDPLWQEVQPTAGVIVLVRVGQHACHTAFSLNAHELLHTWETTGVIAQRVAPHRILGWYRYAGR